MLLKFKLILSKGYKIYQNPHLLYSENYQDSKNPLACELRGILAPEELTMQLKKKKLIRRNRI